MRFELRRQMKLGGRYWPPGSVVDLAALFAGDSAQVAKVAGQLVAADCGVPLAALEPAPADPDTAQAPPSRTTTASKRAKRAEG